jgi:nucleotide-binding universal stress UspA family protein
MSVSASPESATRSILVPVDFEPAARAALVFGARLAESSGAPLTILHVVDDPGDQPSYYRRHGGSEASLPLELLVERRLDELLSDVRGLNLGLCALEAPGVLLVEGLPASRIPEVAKKLGAAQIVMGQARARGQAPGMFASLSDRVADKCDIPVTVVSPNGRSGGVLDMTPRAPFDDEVMLGA